MSKTAAGQFSLNVTELELQQIVDGLELRAVQLDEEIAENENVQWVESVARGKKELAAVEAVLARIDAVLKGQG